MIGTLKWVALPLVISIAAIAWFAAGAAEAQDPDQPVAGKPAAVRIGTYDPRAVAVAYAASDLHRKALDELMAKHRDAKAAGDAKLVKELEARGAAAQRKMHLQGFAAAPVDDILDRVGDQLPAVAREANVTAITRSLDYAAEGVQTVDVTDALVKLFNPNEKTLRTVQEIRRGEPLDMGDIAGMDHRE